MDKIEYKKKKAKYVRLTAIICRYACWLKKLEYYGFKNVNFVLFKAFSTRSTTILMSRACFKKQPTIRQHLDR